MTHVWGGGWDLVFVPLGPLGKMAMQWGVKTRQILAEFVHGPERDNHCDFFSPGKTNHYKPTKEEKKPYHLCPSPEIRCKFYTFFV